MISLSITGAISDIYQLNYVIWYSLLDYIQPAVSLRNSSIRKLMTLLSKTVQIMSDERIPDMSPVRDRCGQCGNPVVRGR